MTETMTEIPSRDAMVRELAISRLREDIATLDKKRVIKRARNTGMTQVEIADALGKKQSSVSVIIKRAKDIAEPKQGFSGETPYEICARYFIGDISKKRLIDELSRWEYAELSKTDGYDGLLVDAPGTFREVERAAKKGMIELDVYETILNRLGRRD